MEGKKVSTETKTSVTRKGDSVTVKIVETITEVEPGKEPKVTIKEKVEKYEGKDGFERMPEDVRKQIEENSSMKNFDVKTINKTAASPTFEKELLDIINKYREIHAVSKLEICKEVSKYALARATEMAEKDEMVKAAASNNHGENTSCMWSNDPNHMACAKDVVKRWYDEASDYDFSTEPSSLKAGHFTQMVWKGTKKFGAAAVKSDSNKIYVVAAYNPPGNWTREFKDNVFPAKSTLSSLMKSLMSKKDDSSSSSEDESKPKKLDEFNDDGLKSHNAYRKKHGVPPLKHCSKLAKYAQEWADHLAKTGKFEHRTGHKFGENLYMASNMKGAADACLSWYSEIQDHTFGREPSSLKTGHFTQVVWKESKKVGMGIAKGSRGWVIVANYDPPGNLIGSYTPNVPAPV